jgi:heme oxygenase
MTAGALSLRLRDATRSVHRVAEHSAFMGALLRGKLPRETYCAYLRNLHAIYLALERALLAHGGPLAAMRPLFRHEAIEADLAHLQGPGWEGLAVVDAVTAYVGRIGHASRAAPHRLVAHAYVRYLGDLSGGQLIRGIVCRAYALGDGDGPGVRFYRFGPDEQAAALKERLREAIDACAHALDARRCDDIVAEAVDAFERHVAIFEEMARGRPARA